MSLFYSFLSRFPLFLRQWWPMVTRTFTTSGVPPQCWRGSRGLGCVRGLFAPAGYLRAAHFLVGAGGGSRGRGLSTSEPQQLETCQDCGTSSCSCSCFRTQKVSSGSQMSWRAQEVPFIEHVYENQIFVMDQSQ